MKERKPAIEVIARALIVRNGSVLVTGKRDKDHLFLPGGHIEWNEPAKKALERELSEELGRRLKAGKFLGCLEHAFGQGRKRVHEINLIFLVSGNSLPPNVVSKEKKLRFQWLPMAKLSQVNIQPYVLRRFIPWWLKKKTPAWAGTMK